VCGLERIKTPRVMRTDALNGRYAPSADFISPDPINRDEKVVVDVFFGLIKRVGLYGRTTKKPDWTR